MELKLFLNKILKVDNIEDYGLKSLAALRESYDKFLEKTGGADPDFPMIDFGDNGDKVQGMNKQQAIEKYGDPDDIEGETKQKPPQEELLELRR